MKFLRNIFSKRTAGIIIGTCVCIWCVLLTLSILENGFSYESNGSRRWVGRAIDEIEEKYQRDKKKITLSTDTVNGNAFLFKDFLVIPQVEMKSDSSGNHQRILNFRLYDTKHKSTSSLFKDNQEISNSKLVQVKNVVLWFIESKGKLYIYDSRNSKLMVTPYPEKYALEYPASLTANKKDSCDVVSDKQIVKAYQIDKTCPSFTIIGNQLLVCARSQKDKRYWIYDLSLMTINPL